jgi:UDP-N-acetyl-D-mannosaminuronate dehydrogenase
MENALPRCVAIVGLGDVGLPLAAAFGKVISTIGFDIDHNRIRELRKGFDRNGELGRADMCERLLEFSSDPAALKRASFILVAVPTPVAKAGLYKAPTIRTAEAAKVIENVQRDLNIALMNELSVLFHRIGVDTGEVLKAARTKWNFLRYEPGLVGGHCIPVDPYYLTFKAQGINHHPEVILAGLRAGAVNS